MIKGTYLMQKPDHLPLFTTLRGWKLGGPSRLPAGGQGVVPRILARLPPESQGVIPSGV